MPGRHTVALFTLENTQAKVFLSNVLARTTGRETHIVVQLRMPSRHTVVLLTLENTEVQSSISR
jgi:hypothetical protein